MSSRSLTERLEIVEQKVEELQVLPDRMAAVESHILQLRGEVRDEFSAIRKRLDDGDEQTRRLILGGDEETRRQMRVLHEEVLSRISLLKEGRNRK